MSRSYKRPQINTTTLALPELPDSIIQKIHSFLSVDDVAKTSIVSKAWLSLWSTYSALKFVQSRFHGDTAKFVMTIDDTLVKYRENNLLIESLEISFKRRYHIDSDDKLDVDADLVFPLINNWLRTAVTYYGLEKLSLEFSLNEAFELPLEIFFKSKTLREVCLTGSKVFMGPIWPLFESNHSLVSLNLTDVSMTQDFLDQLLSCFPLIKNLCLHNCFGINKVNLGIEKLKNLKELQFQISGMYKCLVKFSETVTVAYDTLVLIRNRSPSTFRFDDSRNLTSLELSQPGISCSWSLSKLLPQLPFLTSLILHRFSNSLREIDITSDSLNSLTISSCPYLSVVNISAPRLESFTYRGTKRVPSISFKKDVVGKLKSKLDLVCPFEIDISWFVMLRRVLLDLKPSDRVEVSMRSVRRNPKVCLCFKDLEEYILSNDDQFDFEEEILPPVRLPKVEDVYIHIFTGPKSKKLIKELMRAVSIVCGRDRIIVSDGSSTK